MGVWFPRDHPISWPVRLTGPQWMNIPKRMSCHLAIASGGAAPGFISGAGSGSLAVASDEVSASAVKERKRTDFEAIKILRAGGRSDFMENE